MSENAVTLGAVLRPQVSPEAMLVAARRADQAGLGELWLWEDCFLTGGLTTAAAILASTDRVVVGIGLLPVPLRNVAITAMEIATLDRMFPGRLRVAVGHGVQEWMGQAGARVTSPLGLMREYMSALRALLSGERLDVTGTYVHLDGVSLEWPPASPVPLLMGAIGPKSLALAGECADGVLLDADQSPESVGESIAACRTARAAIGRLDPFETVLYQRYYRGSDGAHALAADPKPGCLDAGLHGDDVTAVVGHIERMRQVGVRTVVLIPAPNEPEPDSYLMHVARDIAPDLG